MNFRLVKQLLIASALVAVAALASIIFVDRYQTYKDNKTSKELEARRIEQKIKAAKQKYFSEIKDIPEINVSVAQFKSKFFNDTIYYIVRLKSGNKKINLPRSLTIELLDDDDFIVRRFKVQSFQFIKEVNDSGQIDGYAYQGRGFFYLEQYVRVSNWSVIWQND